MTSIWFVVPANGRGDLTELCLRQLAGVCNELEAGGYDTGVVVMAEDDNLRVARDLGFEALRRPNRPLGRKWNDGYEVACRYGADFVCPLGSDDWIDPVVFGDLPRGDEIRSCRESSVVREDGRRLARLRIPYQGGDGVRIFPRSLLEMVHFRPAEDARERAIDTSIIRRLTQFRHGQPPLVRYSDAHPFQIVDWKSPHTQLNSYQACLNFIDGDELDPWEALRDRYPAELLEDMRTIYGLPAEVLA